MNKIKIAFFGATRGLSICRFSGIFCRDDVCLAAVCDSYRPALEQFRMAAEENGLYDVKYLSDPERLFDLDFDAIVLANYATEHAPWAVRFLNAGRHVMSELLPMQTLAEAVELTETVERTGLVYQYAENYCYMDQILEMRRIYDNGEVGDVMVAEGNFNNDLSASWHQLTRGEPNSWRNIVPSTFYCTHSIGPLFWTTGRRAVRVMGIEIPTHETLASLGARSGSAAMEIMELDNGGMAKSLNGFLKRTWVPHYSLYCQKGSMETDKLDFSHLHVFREKPFEEKHQYGQYRLDNYYPKFPVRREGVREDLMYSVYYEMECFLGSIRGDEMAKKYAINVYQAMDMALPGIFAYRSILQGGASIEVPDFRDHEQREKYRFDTSCTDPRKAGDMLLPYKHGTPTQVPEDAYERCKELLQWQKEHR